MLNPNMELQYKGKSRFAQLYEVSTGRLMLPAAYRAF
jgi:hypothetical protein